MFLSSKSLTCSNIRDREGVGQTRITGMARVCDSPVRDGELLEELERLRRENAALKQNTSSSEILMVGESGQRMPDRSRSRVPALAGSPNRAMWGPSSCHWGSGDSGVAKEVRVVVAVKRTAPVRRGSSMLHLFESFAKSGTGTQVARAAILFLLPLTVFFYALRYCAQVLWSAISSVRSFRNNKAETSRIQLFCIVLFFVVGAALGVQFVFDLCDYDVGCVRGAKVFSISFMVSRGCGKIASAIEILIVLSVLKPVVNHFEEHKTLKSLCVLEWRHLHIGLSFFFIALTFVHTIAHFIRIYAQDEIELAQGYEMFALATGILLLVILCLQALPFLIMTHDPKLAKSTSWPKKFFRHSHIVLFTIFSIVLCVHSYRFAPLLLLVLYLFLKRFNRLEKTEVFAYVSRDGRGTPKILNLVVRVRVTVPAAPGYYCVVEIGSPVAPRVSTSFTLTYLTPNMFALSIDLNSVFGQTILPIVLGEMATSTTTYNIHEEGGERVLVEQADKMSGKFHRLSPSVPLCFMGYYNSFNYHVLNRSRMVLLVRGTGRVVSDCVLSYYNSNPDAEVVIVHESRFSYSNYSATHRFATRQEPYLFSFSTPQAQSETWLQRARSQMSLGALRSEDPQITGTEDFDSFDFKSLSESSREEPADESSEDETARLNLPQKHHRNTVINLQLPATSSHSLRKYVYKKLLSDLLTPETGVMVVNRGVERVLDEIYSETRSEWHKGSANARKFDRSSLHFETFGV